MDFLQQMEGTIVKFHTVWRWWRGWGPHHILPLHHLRHFTLPAFTRFHLRWSGPTAYFLGLPSSPSCSITLPHFVCFLWKRILSDCLFIFTNLFHFCLNKFKVSDFLWGIVAFSGLVIRGGGWQKTLTFHDLDLHITWIIRSGYKALEGQGLQSLLCQIWAKTCSQIINKKCDKV